MKLPTLEWVVRTIMYWRRVRPRVRILLTKRDVEGAFRRIPLHLDGILRFGAALGSFILVILVLTFGWCMSPPIYSVAADAISIHHRGHRPPDPDRNGSEPFCSSTYVDDGVIVEPDIGIRCELSAACYEQGMVTVLGPGAVNDGKKAEEGRWSTSAVVWGILVDTESSRLTLPWTKLDALSVLIHDPRWDRGSTAVTLRDVQQLVGKLLHLTSVCPAVKPFMSGLLRLMGNMSRKQIQPGALVVPGLPKGSLEHTWEEWWSDVEWLRIIVGTIRSWSVPYSAPLAVAIPLSEWHLVKDAHQGLVVVGSDATMWSVATFNWTTGEWFRWLLPGDMRATVRRDVGTNRSKRSAAARVHDALFMGVLEMAAITLGALAWSHQWRDRLVVFVTDSENAVRWIRKGHARNRYASHMLRILGRLQINRGFSLWAESIPSKDNDIPDCASRSWLPTGCPDPSFEKRWEQLMAIYCGPTLREVSLCDTSKALVLPLRGAFSLRLPWETEDQFRSLLSGTSAAGSGPIFGGRAGGTGWSTTASSVLGLEVTPAAAVTSSSYAPFGGRTGGTFSWARRCMDGTQVDRQSPAYHEDLHRAKRQLLELNLAQSSHKKYQADWRHYVIFCEDMGRPPFLTGANRAGDIDHMLDFVADQGGVLGRKYNTVDGRLQAIRWVHVTAGYPDPLEDAPVLKYAIKALKRTQGAAHPKMPATFPMLELLAASVDLQCLEHRTVWTGLLMGFCFLMRASEYLAGNDGSWDMDKVVRWEDVTFRRNGAVVIPGRGAAPDEVAIQFRRSKGDQFGAGGTRNLFVAGDPMYCVVTQLWQLACEKKSCELSGPVMQWHRNRGVTRGQITGLLKQAAESLGLPTDRLATHSLRAGGATAMYDSGFSDTEISFHGRWSSEAWKVYVHRTIGRSRDLARRMLMPLVIMRCRDMPRSSGGRS